MTCQCSDVAADDIAADDIAADDVAVDDARHYYTRLPPPFLYDRKTLQ